MLSPAKLETWDLGKGLLNAITMLWMTFRRETTEANINAQYNVFVTMCRKRENQPKTSRALSKVAENINEMDNLLTLQSLTINILRSFQPGKFPATLSSSAPLYASALSTATYST